jgi:predicted nuclease of predicted toxin-antitoxin system
VAAFLVDANLPRALSRLLTSAGVVAHDVRDVGLSDRPDREIAAYASAHGYVIITRDVRFGGELHLAGQPFPGVLLVRYPDVIGLADLARSLMLAIGSLGDALLTDSVVVIEPGRVRVRRSR